MNKQEVIFVMFMEPREKDEFERCGIFCCKPESTAPRIKRFCQETGRLPYSEQFVSIAVLRPDEKPCESGAAIYGFEDKPNISSLHYAVLKQTSELLDSIELEGDDDLKQILTLIADRWDRKELYESVMRRLENLKGLPVGVKPRELLKWTRSRGPHNYSEARLNRCLRLEEVATWGICDKALDGDSGEGNSEESNPGDDIASYFK